MAMTLRLTDEEERALVLIAESDGVSKHEAAIRAISEAVERLARPDGIPQRSG